MGQREAARAAACGVAAAIAMSGMRKATTGLGLVRMTPPEEISARGARPIFDQIPFGLRAAFRELAHWGFGATAAVGFGLLPEGARTKPLAGPLYGVSIWALFEAVLAPLLGDPRRVRRPAERAAIIADHVLYGAIIGSSEARVTRRSRRPDSNRGPLHYEC